MSLWTPGGEHPVDREQPDTQPSAAQPDGPPPGMEELDEEQQAQLRAMQEEMEEVRQQLLEAPASTVVANHAMGLYELAAIHLTAEHPKLPEAVLAVDALAALVEGLHGRLGESEATLQQALVQLRAAYLEVRQRSGEGGEPG
jgi:hypothetical protein